MSQFKIDCSDELMEKIEAIAFSETQIEVGGFLVGTYDEKGATVTEVLPARHSLGKSTQLTFTHDTWNALYAELKESGGALVGWFHSHPNFGVFLSEHDQFIQQNFFGANGNITIVVDPIRGRRGWFFSQDGKIEKYKEEVDTTRERLGVSATNPDKNIEAIMGTTHSGMTTGKVVLISAVMSLIGTFLGFGLSNATSGSTAQGDVASLNLRVQFLEQQLSLGQSAVPTETQKPAPTKKVTPPSAKASPKETSTTDSKTPKGTATKLNTVSVVPGQPCVKGTIDPAGKYQCSIKKGSSKKVTTWNLKKPTGTIVTEPKPEKDSSTATVTP